MMISKKAELILLNSYKNTKDFSILQVTWVIRVLVLILRLATKKKSFNDGFINVDDELLEFITKEIRERPLYLRNIPADLISMEIVKEIRKMKKKDYENFLKESLKYEKIL